MALTIEEKYDEVRQLITMGKEKGYLLYEEVNDLLPSDMGSSDELDDIFSMFGSMGIEVVDSEQKFREKSEEEGVELDLTPGALDKTNDPVRMYLREMGTVPLLTREGEVAIAKRIERGKRIMLAQITRTPMAAREILAAGEQLEAALRLGRNGGLVPAVPPTIERAVAGHERSLVGGERHTEGLHSRATAVERGLKKSVVVAVRANAVDDEPDRGIAHLVEREERPPHLLLETALARVMK